MKKLIIYIMVLLAALSCSKKAEYNQTLGLLSKYNLLSTEGGSTQVAVFSNTSWTVEMDHPVSWASIDRFSGYKTGYLWFEFEANFGRARRVGLVFKAGDETRILSMYQSAAISDDDCELTINGGSSSIAVSAEGGTKVLPFETNLIYNLDEMYLTFTYAEGQEPETPWIVLKSVELEQITLEILPNTTGAVRSANVRVTHTDAGGMEATEGDSVYSNTLTIVQTL